MLGMGYATEALHLPGISKRYCYMLRDKDPAILILFLIICELLMAGYG